MKQPKLAIFISIDGLGWQFLERYHAFLASRIIDRKMVKSTPTPSLKALHASIITGKKPYEHGYWAEYYYSPQTSPFGNLSKCKYLPSFITESTYFKDKISSMRQSWFSIEGDWDLGNFPLSQIDLFDSAEKKSMWKPHAFPVPSIFDYMEEYGINWFCAKSEQNDEEKIEQLKNVAEEQKISFAYLKLDDLKKLILEVGTNDRRIDQLIAWYSRKLNELLLALEVLYEEVPFYIFSGNSPIEVKEKVDLIKLISPLNLKEGEDFSMLLEPSFAHFWFHSPGVSQKIRSFLKTIPQGHILSDQELKDEGAYFPNSKYGNCIFIAHPNVLITPSHSSKKEFKAVFGFSSIPGSISSNRLIPQGFERKEHIFALMLRELHLPVPKGVEVVE